jgi:hypothetical protein
MKRLLVLTLLSMPCYGASWHAARRRAHHDKRQSQGRTLIQFRNWAKGAKVLYCAACGLEPAGEAAHTGSDGGLRQKASDYSCIPLCADCHRFGPGAYHAIGRRQFERRRSIDIDALVRRLNWDFRESARRRA